jgi:hypothetical protein
VGFLDPVPPGHARILSTNLEVARGRRRMKEESPNHRRHRTSLSRRLTSQTLDSDRIYSHP